MRGIEIAAMFSETLRDKLSEIIEYADTYTDEQLTEMIEETNRQVSDAWERANAMRGKRGVRELWARHDELMTKSGIMIQALWIGRELSDDECRKVIDQLSEMEAAR